MHDLDLFAKSGGTPATSTGDEKSPEADMGAGGDYKSEEGK